MSSATSLLTICVARIRASEDPAYLETAKTHLLEVEKYLDECGKLAEEADHLVKLGPAVESTRKAVDEYESLLGQTTSLITKLDENRATLDKSAAAFMENCNAYLTSQNEKPVRRDQEGRQGRQAERTPRQGHGGQRYHRSPQQHVIACFSRALRDPEIIIGANKNFDPMAEKFNFLRAHTSQEANLQQINKTEEAANAYRAAMNDLLNNWQTLQQVGVKRTGDRLSGAGPRPETACCRRRGCQQ
ncbi:MAG: hypothetical protein IPH86_19450 [bacterium]|nr:hypothetical protein [bacterium]